MPGGHSALNTFVLGEGVSKSEYTPYFGHHSGVPRGGGRARRHGPGRLGRGGLPCCDSGSHRPVLLRRTCCGWLQSGGGSADRAHSAQLRLGPVGQMLVQLARMAGADWVGSAELLQWAHG